MSPTVLKRRAGGLLRSSPPAAAATHPSVVDALGPFPGPVLPALPAVPERPRQCIHSAPGCRAGRQRGRPPLWEAEPEDQDYLKLYPNGYTSHLPRTGWIMPRRNEPVV